MRPISWLVELVSRVQERGDMAKAELSDRAWQEEIDQQSRELLDMNSESFVMLLREGELDRDDWRVEYLAGLIE